MAKGKEGALEEERQVRGSPLALDDPGSADFAGVGRLDDWNSPHLERLASTANELGGTAKVDTPANSVSSARPGDLQEFHKVELEPDEKLSLSGCRFADLGEHVGNALQKLTLRRKILDKTPLC